jgi:ribonuclease HII
MLRHSFSNKIEAGCDEAGRGCLAGPVFAAAVILPKSFKKYTVERFQAIKLKNAESIKDNN